jgi:hypothetical protein
MSTTQDRYQYHTRLFQHLFLSFHKTYYHYSEKSLFLGNFAALQKASISIVMSVCLSVSVRRSAWNN